MDKKRLRAELRKIRKNINCEDFSLNITKLPEYKNAKTVFIYLSYLDEAKTDKLIAYALKEKTVLVPCCTDSLGNMIAVKIESFNDLKEGMYGIKEPVNPIEYKGEIDFCVVPGIAFSKEGYRLGYGKGYYDRFLEKRKTFKAGLTFDELLVESLPYESHDKKMDVIITKKGELRIK